MSLMNNRWKKTVIRSTRFSPALMDMIKAECKYRRIDFSNYIRLAATAAMKHSKKSHNCRGLKGQHAITYKINKGMTMTNHIGPKRRLKPFKQFSPECVGGTQQREALGETLNEDAIEMGNHGSFGDCDRQCIEEAEAHQASTNRSSGEDGPGRGADRDRKVLQRQSHND